MFAKNYDDTIEYLYSCLAMFERNGQADYKPGLDNTLALLAAFDNPHLKLKNVIHIAGTNGKGSTAHTLASILQSSGFKTALYTSPHLIDFRERIRVDGEMISKERVVDFVDRFKKMDVEFNPSFFELTTVMAFEEFARQDVDFAVIETGLGGRLDSTNVVNPIVSVITNIGFDHVAMLGTTLSEIAFEKAGIIKPRVTVVVGSVDESIRKVFSDRAKELNCDICFVDDSNPIISCRHADGMMLYETKDYGQLMGELEGDYQQKNMATVLSVVRELVRKGFNIDQDCIRRGFESVMALTGFKGRWTTLRENPKVVYDTAHNSHGWQEVCKQLSKVELKKTIILGFVADKDVEDILALIKRYLSDAKLYFTAPKCKRRLPESELQMIASIVGLQGDAFPNIEEAYKKALAESDKSDFIFIGGSNYMISDLLTSLQ